MITLTKQMQEQFNKMCSTGKLFRSSLSGQQVWDLYLGSFKNDPVYRSPESSVHNCNLCKSFLRRYGNIVAVDSDYKLMTIFDTVSDEEYVPAAKELVTWLTQLPISEVFFETFEELNSLPYEKCSMKNAKFQLGVSQNFKEYTISEADLYKNADGSRIVAPGLSYAYNHMHLFVDTKYVKNTGESINTIMAQYRDNKNVFKSLMEVVSLDTLILVKDLILQNSLLDGQTHLYKLDAVIPLKKEFDTLSSAQKDNWCWIKSYEFQFAKFKNELIGVLCTELAEGKELNAACKSWNQRVDPINYMKASAPITQNQIEKTKKFIVDNGYEESFDRRHAVLDDIKVSEIRHINAGDGKLKAVSIFDGVKSTSTRHKRSEFDGVEEIGIEKFLQDILPNCTSVEAFLTNRHEGNLTSITTSNVKDSKPMFKWSNNYSWTVNGNLAGKSLLAEMVEAKGGRTDGAFRFSHSWNKLERNQSLMDLHVFMPGCQIPKQFDGGPNVTGRRVGWNKREDFGSGGKQDVDYVDAAPLNYVPVENITFPSIDKMPEGVYTCAINNWNYRVTGGKGEAEIAFQGETYQYVYPKTKDNEWIIIAEVTLKNKQFTIKHILEPVNDSFSTKEIYGLETNRFHKVNLVCLSPNHWDGNNVGNKHYFFMLENCKCPTPIRGFHIENLNSELLEHRRVLEVLGNVTMIEPSDKQLSGLSFNATIPDELILKLQGSFKRVVKIKF